MTDSTFQILGVRPRTDASLAAAGFREPNPLQKDALPLLLNGRDCVLQAPTGSGKTLAFGIPLVERLAGHDGQDARALILVPTRELATQVAQVIRQIDRGLRTVLLMGGVGYGAQISGLNSTPDVIVACPGRLLDLASRGDARLGRIEYLVLDEADEMLDQGFARDVERIISLCPAGTRRDRQTVLASATMPEWVESMIAKHLSDPDRIEGERGQAPLVEHGVFTVAQQHKMQVLSSLLERQRAADLRKTIVFHRTKHGVKKLARDLEVLGHRAAELQGNLSQNARDRAIASFRSGETDVLVATNVAARGIDVASVGLVINFELPETPQWLTHRIGRTARNGANGKAITFMSELDADHWKKLRRDGAPALCRLDGERYLTTGEWSLGDPVASPHASVPRDHAPRAFHSRGQWRQRSSRNMGGRPVV